MLQEDVYLVASHNSWHTATYQMCNSFKDGSMAMESW